MLKRVCLSVMAAATVSIGTISLSYADSNVEYVNKPDAHIYPSMLHGHYYVGLMGGPKNSVRQHKSGEYFDPYTDGHAMLKQAPGYSIIAGYYNNYRWGVEAIYTEHEKLEYTARETNENKIYKDSFREFDVGLVHQQPIYSSSFSWIHRVGFGYLFSKGHASIAENGSLGREGTKIRGVDVNITSGPEYTYNLGNGTAISARISAKWSSAAITALASGNSADGMVAMPTLRFGLLYHFA